MLMRITNIKNRRGCRRAVHGIAVEIISLSYNYYQESYTQTENLTARASDGHVDLLSFRIKNQWSKPPMQDDVDRPTSFAHHTFKMQVFDHRRTESQAFISSIEGDTVTSS